MTKNETQTELAAARVTRLGFISGLWLIPIVTLITGAVMLYQEWKSQGPLITISFDNASGLEAGVTKIKTRDVEVGEVEEITLNSNANGVLVYARIHNEFRELLAEDSRFWVVQPTISLSGISGLSTLVSGQYIRLSPGSTTSRSDSFIGLNQPPLTPLGTPGLAISLVSDGDFSFAKGDLIHHQGINVGKIEDLQFNFSENRIYYQAFIEAPYHQLISQQTRFWKTSGMRADLTSDGFSLDVDALDTVLSGGLSFTTPPGLLNEEAVSADTVFYIYPNRAAINERNFNFGLNFWVMVRNSISGLSPGSQVMYRGVQIGRVLRTDYLPEGRNLLDPDVAIPVLIEINPGRIGLPDIEDSIRLASADINNWIRQGLSATIKSKNILLGEQLIELQYEESLTPQSLQIFNGYTVIPTSLDSIDKFTYSLEELLSKLNALPIDSLIRNADTLVNNAAGTLDSFRELAEAGQSFIANNDYQELLAQLTETLAELETLARTWSDDSANSREINSTLESLNQFIMETQPLIMELRNKPNSLIFNAPAQELIPGRRIP